MLDYRSTVWGCDCHLLVPGASQRDCNKFMPQKSVWPLFKGMKAGGVSYLLVRGAPPLSKPSEVGSLALKCMRPDNISGGCERHPPGKQ